MYLSTESCGKITFLQKKNIYINNMQCCRTYASERKLGEIFSPTLSNRIFKEYSEH